MTNTQDNPNQLATLQRALLALKEMNAKFDAIERSQTEPIAIIGVGCRFPGGANDPEAFWELLSNGVDAIGEVPSDRWNVDAYYDSNPEAPGKTYTRTGGFLDTGVDRFDADFFGLTPREAMSMDPQQRLLLEVSWEVLENAGHASDRLVGSKTGVFVGITTNDYAQYTLFSEPTQIDIYTATGNALNVAAGRLSYTLGLQGPSIALDTACSSSLVTVHLACQSLRAQECNMALAGGVNLMLSQEVTIAMSKLRALAPDGRCKTFDAAADGYGRGEGCGMVLLKRLSDAIADGDNILALIRGSAVNQDGRSSGLTVPNAQAQQALIRTALANARVEPAQLSYVEAHGTGTSLGDPIEVKILESVLGEGRKEEQSLMVGSVKTNIGHLEPAAGIAGLIKVVLAMQHKQIPPHLHLNQLNPHILAQQSPIKINIPTQLTPWSVPQGQRRLAGVSSFAFSGTNAHVVLEEAPCQESISSKLERPLHLLTLSAKSKTALQDLAVRFENYLTNERSASLADICFTANSGRGHFAYRLAIIADSLEKAKQQLADFTTYSLAERNYQCTNQPIVAFLFADRGSDYVHMGRELYDSQPTFRKTLERCDEILRSYLEQPLLKVLYPDPDTTSPLEQTPYTQLALFAIEYALAELWMSWGIEPTIVMGQGIGEYVAACIAGVFSLEDGLKLIAERGQIMQELTQDGQRAALERIAQSVQYHVPHRQLISSISGKLVKGLEVSNANYWGSRVQEDVTFATIIETLQEQGCEIFIEIGPNPLLREKAQQCLPKETGLWLPSLQQGQSDWQQMLQSLATLYMQGAEVNWCSFDSDYCHQRIALPTYPFQRESYWLPTAKGQPQTAVKHGRAGAHPLLNQILHSPLQSRQFESQFHLDKLPLVSNHRLYGMPLVNLVIYLEMVSAGAREAWDRQVQILENIFIPQALTLAEDETRLVHLILESQDATRGTFQISSLANSEVDGPDGWNLHITGQLRFEAAEPVSLALEDNWFTAVQSEYEKEASPPEFYQMMRDRGADLGSTCQWLDRIWQGHGRALGQIRLPRIDEVYEDYLLPLGVVDACFQLLAACLPPSGDDYMLVSVESFRFYGYSGQPLWGEASVQLEGLQDTIPGNIRVLDENGLVVIEVFNAQLRKVSRDIIRRSIMGTKNPSTTKRQPEKNQFSREKLFAADLAERQSVLERYLVEILAKTLQLPVSKLEPQQSLTLLVDSLVTVELKNQIEADLQVSVPATKFFEDTTIAQLAAFVLSQIAPDSTTLLSSLEQNNSEILAQALAEIEGLSENEVQVILASEKQLV